MGKGKERETSMCGCLSHASWWGPDPQPRHVPWLGIEPATFGFTGPRSIHWATPARVLLHLLAGNTFIKKFSPINYWVTPRSVHTREGGHMLYSSSLFIQFSKWVTPYHPKVTNEFLLSIIMNSCILMYLTSLNIFQLFFPTDAQVPSLASGSLFQLPPKSFSTWSR